MMCPKQIRSRLPAVRLPGAFSCSPTIAGLKKGFFASIKHSLPLDPPLQNDHSWDALADSLWEGLYRLPEEKILVLWPGASRLAAMAPTQYAMAIDVLAELATSRADVSATQGLPIQLVVLGVA
ncbi:hypothetical protein VARIO8X_50579 [Burkholderiales bacterium 8X]|nr:hypothetical protein VARIO8X_50579 [Burkholderiales bacterium 8X]